MDQRLRFNAAVFRTDVEDNQFFEFFAGPFGLLRTVTTIDELTISGLRQMLCLRSVKISQFMVVSVS